ncbi:MAG TPA: prenyltransferase/squalene oxidase repeat-containing protein [Solirubrobacterales bacterium]|nr:prenyltransferase/squalene oxidase repeat-containing protein [Solirubrobacterales bacterium]
MLLAASAAAAISPTHQATLDRTVRYLQEAQQSNGGFGGSGEPSQITSAWTALALAAVGINPRDQARPGGVDVHSYLVSHYRQGIEESECAPIACTTTFERELMVVNTAGTDPHDFGGVDLVRELLDRVRPDGSFPHVPGGQPGVNDTIFAIFALALVGEAAARAAIPPAADWIETAQLDNGGWAWGATSTRDEVDMTGAAIQALVAAGRAGSDAVQEGIAYLRAAQNGDGGFPEFPGNPESNVASTAWAVQAIWAVGDNPEAWGIGPGEATEEAPRASPGLPAKEPLDYMESLQEPDGHIRWKRSQDLNGVWMTAYTTPAFAGHYWPIPFVPLAVVPPSVQPAPGDDDAGVIAGGGGRGAPLFSRPKPQSRGRTPGGARVIGDEGARPTNHSGSRRGDNALQPAGIAEREPSAAEVSSAAPPAVVGTTEARSSTTGGGNGGSPAAADQGSRGKGSGGGGEEAGEEVTGLVVGSPGAPFFGAPGLRGEPADDGNGFWTALGIGAAALLAGLLGARAERRRQETLPGVPA